MRSLPFLLLAGFFVSANAGDEHAITRLDKRMDDLVPADAVLEKIGEGFTWVEGPVWDRKNNVLLFSDIPANAIMRWKEGKGIDVFMKPSGYTGAKPFTGREPGSNGLTFDHQERLLLCEHGDRRVTRVERDGEKSVLADRYDGKRFNSPNDLVVAANGDIYFTDPPFGLPGTFNDPGRELDFCGVYRIASDGVHLVIRDIKAPNGIGLSPDGKTLYVTDVDGEHPRWMAYDVEADGSVSHARIFHDGLPFKGTAPGAPDGLKIDQNGNVFGSGPGGIYVFAPDGTHLGTIRTGVATSNCGWGEDGSTLFITADKAVYRIRLTTKGEGY